MLEFLSQMLLVVFKRDIFLFKNKQIGRELFDKDQCVNLIPGNNSCSSFYEKKKRFKIYAR